MGIPPTVGPQSGDNLDFNHQYDEAEAVDDYDLDDEPRVEPMTVEASPPGPPKGSPAPGQAREVQYHSARKQVRWYDGTDTPNPPRAIMQIIVSLVVLGLAIYLVGWSDGQEEAGTGLIGGVVGYWLR